MVGSRRADLHHSLSSDEGDQTWARAANRFSNILCQGENGIYIQGWESNPITDLALDNVRVEVGKYSTEPGGFYDARPDGLFKGVYNSVIAGIHCAHARSVALRHCQVHWGADLPQYYGPALRRESVQQMQIEDFQGTSAERARKAHGARSRPGGGVRCRGAELLRGGGVPRVESQRFLELRGGLTRLPCVASAWPKTKCPSRHGIQPQGESKKCVSGRVTPRGQPR